MAAVAQAYEVGRTRALPCAGVAQRLNLKEADMRRFVTALQRNKTIVRMGSDDLFIHSGALKELTAQIAALRGSLMDVARFKQLTGLSRKYAIPFLEYLDRQRITRKQGDQRLGPLAPAQLQWADALLALTSCYIAKDFAGEVWIRCRTTKPRSSSSKIATRQGKSRGHTTNGAPSQAANRCPAF